MSPYNEVAEHTEVDHARPATDDTLHLPSALGALLDLCPDPTVIPPIAPEEPPGGLEQLLRQVLDRLNAHGAGIDGAFTESGHTHLPLLSSTAKGPAVYVRLAVAVRTAKWPVSEPIVVLPLAGTMELEVYDSRIHTTASAAQYVRRFEPNQVFALYPGTQATTRSSADGVQLLVTQAPLKPVPDRRELTTKEYDSAVHRAQILLRAALSSAPRTQRSVKSAANWLTSVDPLRSTDLRVARRAAGHVLDRLAGDRELLSRLVREIEHDPNRLAASRTTLLLDRLSLFEAPGGRFEVRLNFNPRPDNQLVPHDHCYTFATRILTGGYLHRVWRRTDDGDGDFTPADLQPGVVTIERPGSSYVLGHQAVHQAFMRPGTVTLFLRGPRLKARSHAAQELMPDVSSWPTPPSSGLTPVPSRPATFEEYAAMRDYLLQHGVIG